MTLPTELYYEICECVLAVSIHVVCTAEKTPVWEMNVIANLTAVSEKFRAITIDLYVKALAGSRSSEIDQVRAGRGMMKYLRRLAGAGEDENKESESPIWSKIPEISHWSPLLQGYVLYLNTVNLRKAYRESKRRQKEPQSSSACSLPQSPVPPPARGVDSEVVKSRINRQSMQVLQLALEKSDLVYPRQMGALLDKAVREEIGEINSELD
ncbi:hypothetical protein NEOLEDRAFT_1148271 [Neolentinus lepideus HHB14362 ss-1]|uniref:Uncharacterized protein n=1 Tax=Neolentinus lepideus HHB14362 ss-1 TaxID=1314782 RepID=A0A165SDY6_9AGAM|nr:hypothetical protein NEOLEDRAFT_1148271 [Neolentinus lepideus HHB14362 ss-1]